MTMAMDTLQAVASNYYYLPLQNEKLRETIHRLRDRIKITWNKSKFEESMEQLHESNGDLQRLGEQMRKIKEITSEKTAVSDLNKQLKVASSLVAVLIEFPWLAQYLTLRDISLLQSSNDLSKWIPTLRLDTSFVDSRSYGAVVGGREAGMDDEDAKLDYMIRKLTVSTPRLNTCPIEIMTHVSMPPSSGT